MGRAQRHIVPAKNPYEQDGLNVIIPVAGIGKRMKAKGPKCLFMIKQSMSILEHQIHIIKNIVPHAEIVVVAGFEGNKVRETIWGMARIVYSTEYENMNVMHSISLGLDAVLPKPTMIIHGDVVFNAAAIQILHSKPTESSILIDLNHEIDKDKVGVARHENQVTNLSHGLPTKWSQMVYLTGKEFHIFRKLAKQAKVHRWFTYETLNEIINSEGQFITQQSRNIHICEINRYNDLVKAKKIGNIT